MEIELNEHQEQIRRQILKLVANYPGAPFERDNALAFIMALAEYPVEHVANVVQDWVRTQDYLPRTPGVLVRKIGAAMRAERETRIGKCGVAGCERGWITTSISVPSTGEVIEGGAVRPCATCRPQEANGWNRRRGGSPNPTGNLGEAKKRLQRVRDHLPERADFA